MHGLAAIERGSAGVPSSDPFPRAAKIQPPIAADAYRYGADQRPNAMAIATIILGHALLLVALVKMDVIEIGRKPPPPLTVNLISIAPPPPAQAADPKPEIVPLKPVQRPIVVPPGIVPPLVPPPPVTIAAAAPPPPAVAVAEAEPRSVASGPPVAVDLSTKMVSAKPPRYPIESRRKREQGIVVLRLLLGFDGAVAEIAVARSSGFERLDEAAIDAVRRWRWSPTLQDGAAVQVRGMVEIPFVLQG
jgi:protein TonB